MYYISLQKLSEIGYMHILAYTCVHTSRILVKERERMKDYKELPQIILEAKKAQDLWLTGSGLKKRHNSSLSPKTGGKKKSMFQLKW